MSIYLTTFVIFLHKVKHKTFIEAFALPNQSDFDSQTIKRIRTYPGIVYILFFFEPNLVLHDLQREELFVIFAAVFSAAAHSF